MASPIHDASPAHSSSDPAAGRLAARWRNDAAAHARRQSVIADLARQLQPYVPERPFIVDGPLQSLLPAFHRGAIVHLEGRSGTTSLAYMLAAAVTRLDEWVGALDADGSLHAVAAHECGVALERFVVARHVNEQSWLTAAATLIDGMSCVLLPTPNRIRLQDARRLAARARERGSALIVLGAWPGEANWRVRVLEHDWPTFRGDTTFLARERAYQLNISGPGCIPQPQTLAFAG